jgi:hypothetical protein
MFYVIIIKVIDTPTHVEGCTALQHRHNILSTVYSHYPSKYYGTTRIAVFHRTGVPFVNYFTFIEGRAQTNTLN